MSTNQNVDQSVSMNRDVRGEARSQCEVAILVTLGEGGLKRDFGE